MAKKVLWSIHLPYEYDDFANDGWYGNFDYQNFKDLFVPGPESRYLGKNKEWVDKSSDTNKQYGEFSLKVQSEGWYNWLGDQMTRTVKSQAGFLELDNQDHALERSRKAVGEAFITTIRMGLMPILKNPEARDIKEFGALKDDAGRIMTAGCVFETGAMSPLDFAKARARVNPKLGGTWVRHGGSSTGTSVMRIKREVVQVPGTSVQWGPREYEGMRIIAANPAK